MKISLVVLSSLLLGLLPQEKITLKSQPRQGDKFTSTQKMGMKIKVTVLAGGQKFELQMEQKASEKKTMELQSVAGDKVTKAFYHIQEDIEEKKEPGAEEFTRTEKPLHGRKITVQSKDGGLVYEGADGLDEKTRQSLDLDDDFAKTFPAKPVGVGESWEVPAEALKDIFNDEKLGGKMTLKLTEVKDFQGRRAAFLATQLELKGSIDEGIEMTASLKGTVVVWIERGYTLEAKLEGTMSMKGKAGDAEMSGQGPMTVDVSTTVH